MFAALWCVRVTWWNCLNGLEILQTFWQQETTPAPHHCAHCPAPILINGHAHTHTHTHWAYYTRTCTTQTPKRATPPCTCPQPHVDTLAVKLLRFTWRHNWHKLLSRWYRSCCLRPSIPLLSSFLPLLKEEHRDKEASLCMILISWRTSPCSSAPRPFATWMTGAQ